MICAVWFERSFKRLCADRFRLFLPHHASFRTDATYVPGPSQVSTVCTGTICGSSHRSRQQAWLKTDDSFTGRRSDAAVVVARNHREATRDRNPCTQWYSPGQSLPRVLRAVSLRPIRRRLRPEPFLWPPEIAPQGPLVVSSPPTNSVPMRIAMHRHWSWHRRFGPQGSLHADGGGFTILQKEREHYSNGYDSAPMPFMERLTWDGIAPHGGRLPGCPAIRHRMAACDCLCIRGALVRDTPAQGDRRWSGYTRCTAADRASGRTCAGHGIGSARSSRTGPLERPIRETSRHPRTARRAFSSASATAACTCFAMASASDPRRLPWPTTLPSTAPSCF